MTACSPLIGPGRFAAWATDLGVTVFDTGAAMKKADMSAMFDDVQHLDNLQSEKAASTAFFVCYYGISVFALLTESFKVMESE